MTGLMAEAFGLACLYLCATASYAAPPNQLLLISMDGFRWDYLDKADTPNFRRLISEGVYAKRVKGVFPSLTFPSHWSIVTGRYPENHGIISNGMYDPVTKETFSVSTADEKWWNASEPIWLTAMKQGLTAAAYFWPGSAVEFQGYRPKHWFKFSEDTPNLVRVNEVIRWLKDEKIDLAALYFDQPDSFGHSKGPEANETLQVVEEMDSVLGYLTHKLRTSGLEGSVNVIVTADHGMTAVPPDQVIRLPKYTDWTNVEWSYLAAIGLIYPKQGFTSKIYADLKNAHPRMKVFYKEELPERLHFNKSNRITPIVILADQGWVLTSLTTGGSFMAGYHGYDNNLTSMNSMLVARGPDFRQGYVKDSIDLVDIYPLMCHISGLTPQPHDGKLANVIDLTTGYDDGILISVIDRTSGYLVAALQQFIAKALEFWRMW